MCGSFDHPKFVSRGLNLAVDGSRRAQFRAQFKRRRLQRDAFGTAWLSARLGSHASATLQGIRDVSRLGAEREQRAQKQVH